MTVDADTTDHNHPDHETIPLPYSMTPEAIECETILVHMIVTEIATPLAKAFSDMPATGLVNTRYTCYCDAVATTLDRHTIPFLYHTIDIPALVERVWRDARGIPA